MAKKTITPAQTAALIWFAEKHGRTWKAALRAMWMHGAHIGTAADSESELYALRNTHGPSWLAGYQPPKPAAVIPARTSHERNDTGRYQSGYRTFRNGTEREDFGSDR